jgi:hypothetical protein
MHEHVFSRPMSTPPLPTTAPVAPLASATDAIAVPAALPPVLAGGLAAVHLFSHRLRFLDVVPRSRWLSLSGGSAVAYVFVHLLPELAHPGAVIEESGSVLGYLEQHVYLVGLLGFTVFYGLEQVVRRPPDVAGGDGGNGEAGGAGVFWLHIGSFALYNGLIGYLLLHREETVMASLLTFALAMGLHFLVNDYSLQDHHGRAYHCYARWLLAGAVFLGLGSATSRPSANYGCPSSSRSSPGASSSTSSRRSSRRSERAVSGRSPRASSVTGRCCWPSRRPPLLGQ